MKTETQSSALGAVWFFRSIAVWGPGLLVMLADTDAGNVVTAAQSGAQWGYRLLPLVLLLIPMLYMVQESTVRLGVYTGRGHGELIRVRFGLGWARLSTLGLAGAVVGSLITEFTGVAGVGELVGLSRSFSLPLAAATLLIIVASGSYSGACWNWRALSSPGPHTRAWRRWRGTRSICRSAIVIFCSWARRSLARPS